MKKSVFALMAALVLLVPASLAEKAPVTREYFERLDKDSSLEDIVKEIGQFGLEGSGIVYFVWRLDDGSRAKLVFNSRDQIEMIYIDSENGSERIYKREHGKDEPGADSAEKKRYVVSRVSAAPDWDSIPSIPIDKGLWTDDTGIRARGQLCCDDDNLYVHLSAAEKDIRAENTEPLSPVYEDSCLEFFLQVGGSDNYFNFEINPNGCLCSQYGPTKSDRVNLVRDDAAEYFGIRAGRTADGWEVYYQIPLSFIRLFIPEARFEGEWRANMYKCGNKTVNKHYLSWTQIDLEKPNFHCPEYFGTIVFE